VLSVEDFSVFERFRGTRHALKTLAILKNRS
jgi:hypothetical protein